MFHLRVSNFTRFDQFQAVHDHIFTASSTPSVTYFESSSTLYECSVCHGLAPDFQTLINHNGAMYVNGKWYLSKKILHFNSLSGSLSVPIYFPPRGLKFCICK